MANIFIISAPSGCGKTSLVNELINRIDNICVAVSHTTRSPRQNEVDGENYFFVSKEDFNQIKNNNGFIENAVVFDNQYGSAKKTIEDLLKLNKDVILEIDWQGARQVRNNYPKAVSIFILPPSIQSLNDRLSKRDQDSESIVKKRMLFL